jgi:hypothetical protein
MATEMAEYAYTKFRSWYKHAPSEERSTTSLAFLNWLRADGLEVVGEQYGLAVETLLLVLSRRLDPAIEPATSTDKSAWDYMTVAGFLLEIYQYRRPRFGRE